MISVNARHRHSDERSMSGAIYKAVTAAKEGNAPIGPVITRNRDLAETSRIP